MGSFIEIRATFSGDSYQRGKDFERLCKWFLETDPRYSGKLTEVWLWDDWPGRWGPDCGIDLIAQDAEGKTWAIQAKCYDADNSITKQDVDSFLSESTNIDKIHHRLLIATTNNIAANARRVIEHQHSTIPINQVVLADLIDAPIDWPKSINDLTTGQAKPKFLPQPHQSKAIKDVVDNLEGRGQLIMACGTGKTLTGLWIAEALRANTILVVLPSLLLLSKTLTDWLTHSNESFSYLPVCSDETVSKSEDVIKLSSSELSFPSTTDASEITSFVRGAGKKVIFSTYQSSGKIAEAFKDTDLKPFDLVICDEAHRCAGKVESTYTTVLNNELIPAVNRLFMTATPKLFKAHFVKKAGESGMDVISMDNESMFGPVLHKLSFAQAINNQPPLLTDYQVIIVGIDNPSYAEMVASRDLVNTDTGIESNAQSFASHVGLAKALKQYNLKRVISFHSRVKSAKEFSEELPQVIDWMPKGNRPDGELVANYVSGDMPTNQRANTLQRLAAENDGQYNVLSNARCLSEGIDVPALDGIAFIDPKNSEIDIIQAVGRAIRLSSGKSKGTIVLPVFIEENDHPDEVLQSSSFKKVWAVVNALRSHDEDFGEQLDEIRRGLGRKNPQIQRPDKIIFDLPKLITQDFEDALDTKLVESATTSWQSWYGMLEEYKQAEGHVNVPKGHKHGDFKLGNWIVTQRTSRKSNDKNLTPERIEQLEALGFDWDPFKSKFQAGIAALKEYKQAEGHVNVPANYKHGDFSLGAWTHNQRQAYKNNNERLTPERIEQLEALGFDWRLKR